MSSKSETVYTLEFIDTLAKKQNFVKYETKTLVEAVVDLIVEIVSSGKTVYLNGLGKIEPRKRAARIGKDFVTNKIVDVPEYVTAFFVPSESFRKAMNKSEE